MSLNMFVYVDDYISYFSVADIKHHGHKQLMQQTLFYLTTPEGEYIMLGEAWLQATRAGNCKYKALRELE